MSETCCWCRESTADPVDVGIEHVASAGGRTVYACRTCVKRHGIIPFADHPAGSDGRLRFTAEALRAATVRKARRT
ncbi:hypothetical protein ACH4FX_12640 [Streptomyces sp. NPDC018019]|uniref:hypothetical protein n=1 Tax=Streptomyces sp. NPDC018019 TaxID=3365030 RepID=UPI00379FE98B